MTKNSILFSNLFLTFSAFLFAALPIGSRASDSSMERGKAIFEMKCSPCHTIGGGTKVGPDLKGVTEQRPQDWLVNFISNPEKMFQAGDPIAKSILTKFGGIKMPGPGLSQQEVSDVLSYLSPQQPPSGASLPKGGLPIATVGDSLRGKKLFIGTIVFQNGGPPCMSCHHVSGTPFPGGGTLGPDLTISYSKFGAATMNSLLATLPFPTMTPIFSQRPLTPQEQHDLGAFFEKASTPHPAHWTLTIILSEIGGFVVLMILIGWIWRKRLLAVRRPLVEQAIGRREARS